MRAIRGAITVGANEAQAIREATVELLEEIRRRNNLCMEEVVSIFFSVTRDLDAEFPARAARTAGWDVPMLDVQEMPVPGSLPCCLRVLIHVDRGGQVDHVYLREAATLRPDLGGGR